MGLLGIVAQVTAVDTVTRLLWGGLEELPAPRPGEPIAEDPGPRLKRRSAWIAMTGPPVPRFALSAVPSSQAMVNRLLDRLYIPKGEMEGRGMVRALHRAQMEVVVVSVSLANECFY